MTSACTECGDQSHSWVDCPRRHEDNVNHPKHYTNGRFELIDLIEDIVASYPDAVIGGSIWQVVKYVGRAPHKGNLSEDLKKARWYLDRAISHAERKGPA